ncbi:MAG: LytTR family DNA-binding domain-containing protein [Eubacteriales bacterium]|nr:LytTR family DNA-binding domain-containing protein [Eubacteriales bacterium]
MKIAVCDDNHDELTRIKELLDEYASCNNQNFIIKCFSSSVELASTAEFEKYDIYILDIIMPVMDGLSLAREIRTFDKSSPVIFLTSSPEFAVESYTVKAFNYLLKPVDKIHLYNTVDDIMEIFHNEQYDTFIIKNNSGIHKIYLSDIVYAEALNRKVILHLKNNEQIVSTDVFSSVCDTLIAHKEFTLPHRSFIVNMNYIRTIDTEKILLNSNKTIPVAQRRVSDIKKQYLEFQMEE